MLLTKLLAALPFLALAAAAPGKRGDHHDGDKGHKDKGKCYPNGDNKHDNPSTAVPEGFVTTKGTEFWLDGAPFYFSGANAYWVPQLVHDDQYRAVFDEFKDLGVKVLRTWAFSMLQEPIAGDIGNLTYYQYWANGTSYLNLGHNGLKRLDRTVAFAEEYDIKLILTFVNNWNDYGGMDVYINQTLGSAYHTDFYTYQPMIDAYDDYVSELVKRYRHSKGIFAWELTNEARANGWPAPARPNATTEVLTNWIAGRAKLVKSLDPHHMVAIGTTDFDDYVYNGTSGCDFERNTALDDIDFGTFHLYPQDWAPQLDPLAWGLKYIQQHINSMHKIGKPVLMEEFNLHGYTNQTTILPQWIKLAEEGGIPGIMPWGLGVQGLDRKDSTVYYNDEDWLNGMDIYRDKTEFWSMWKDMGDYMNKKTAHYKH